MEEGKWVKGRLPIVEGKCMPISRMGIDGQIESCYPEPTPEKPDPEMIETDTFAVTGKEEYWDYETICRKCKTVFIAYDAYHRGRIRNYCPGCGMKLI
jgi:hypothetical protein